MWSNLPLRRVPRAPVEKNVKASASGRCRDGAHESNPTLKLGVWASLVGIYKLRTCVCAGLNAHLKDLVRPLAYARVRSDVRFSFN